MAKVGDVVLVFNLFEGTILEVKDNEVILYSLSMMKNNLIWTTEDNFILSGTSI